YTGTFHSASSSLLFKSTNSVDRTIIDFHALVPPVASVQFSDLLPTGITSNVLDTSIARLARYLATDTDIAAQVVAAIVNASNIQSTPVGDVSATNVQSAIEELAGDKLARQNNLSELTNPAIARNNLELGTAALMDMATFAFAEHQHNGRTDLFWETEPPGSNQLVLTNAPNSISGHPLKWLIVTLDGDRYAVPAWRIND
ncbi:MAG: hypothetical protein ACRC8Y_05145, partial [Chroococcales cyanobacterium]